MAWRGVVSVHISFFCLFRFARVYFPGDIDWELGGWFSLLQGVALN